MLNTSIRSSHIIVFLCINAIRLDYIFFMSIYIYIFLYSRLFDIRISSK